MDLYMINEMILGIGHPGADCLRISKPFTCPFMVLLRIIQNLVAVLSKTVPTGHMWLLSPQNAVRAGE